MAEHPSSDNHPQIPGTSSMAWFAVFLAVTFLGLTIFLQLHFGNPAAP